MEMYSFRPFVWYEEEGGGGDVRRSGRARGTAPLISKQYGSTHWRDG